MYEPLRINYEYRVQVLSPPFVFYNTTRPVIRGRQMNTTVMQYRQEFTIPYSFPTIPGCPIGNTDPACPSITRVTIVAPSSVTRSFNMNQRVVGLRIVSVSAMLGFVVLCLVV